MHSLSCRFEVTATPNESILETVRQCLRAYNRSSNPDFFAIVDNPTYTKPPLNAFAFDETGACIGGLLGATDLSWLKIDILAVHADHRRSGIGQRLMRLAEDEARSRGCRYCFLDTMSYQAPDFYRKLGYQISGRLEDWDSHGHTKFLLTKSLV